MPYKSKQIADPIFLSLHLYEGAWKGRTRSNAEIRSYLGNNEELLTDHRSKATSVAQ